MKKLLLALSLLVSPAMAQSPPQGIKPVMVQMQLFCTDSFEFLMDLLAMEFQESPVMMGYLKEGDEPNTWLEACVRPCILNPIETHGILWNTMESQES